MISGDQTKPRVVLICHSGDKIDTEGLAAWLACCFTLQAVVVIRDPLKATVKRVRREYRRVGLVRLIDVLLFRLYYVARHAAEDRARLEQALAVVKERYPADLKSVPVLETDNPNSHQVQKFLRRYQPDLVLARCKYILKPEVFRIPTQGTFVLHPGICPEYRNAHGCFWALANRDFDRVGMTLLRVDAGVDTGPVYLQSSYAFDELEESHVVIQYRVVLENLEGIAEVLHAVCRGQARACTTNNRCSMAWGQPRLSAYLNWRRAARSLAA